jgi:hypothetical protein
MLGAVTGFSYGVRPANAFVIASFAVLIFLEARRNLIPYIAGAVIGVTPLVLHNLLAFGTLSTFYYRLLQDMFWRTPIRGFVYWAYLFSPSRGLFIFSPFLLFVFLRLSTRRFRTSWTRLDKLLAGLCVAWFLFGGKFPVWAGGGSYGPRLLCELCPCLIVLLIPVAQALSLEGSRKARAATALFVVAGALSIAIHLRGATARQPNYDWNEGPPDINTAPEKALSWKDPQFLRGWGSPVR